MIWNLFLDAEAQEDGVGNLDKHIVNTIDVDVLDSPLLHVLEQTIAFQLHRSAKKQKDSDERDIFLSWIGTSSEE